MAFVRKLHTARPDWPLWIYYEPREPVIQRVADVAMLSGVWATAQVSHAAQDAEVRVHVQRLIDSAPPQRLLHYLDPLLRQLPAEVRGFFAAQLGRRNEATLAQAPARHAETETRSDQRRLERICQVTGLPAPSTLLDHLLFTYVAFSSVALNVPLGVAAEDAALSPKALRGLLRRAMGTDARWAALAPASLFEFAIVSFAKACSMPEQLAQDVVQQVALER